MKYNQPHADIRPEKFRNTALNVCNREGQFSYKEKSSVHDKWQPTARFRHQPAGCLVAASGSFTFVNGHSPGLGKWRADDNPYDNGANAITEALRLPTPGFSRSCV